MQVALSASDKLLVKTFFITFIAVVAGLPVASALMPSTHDASAQTTGVTSRVSDATGVAGLGACATADGMATGTGSATTRNASTATPAGTTTYTTHTNTVTRELVNASVPVSDVADVNTGDIKLVDATVGNISVPVLNNTNANVPAAASILNNATAGLPGIGAILSL